MKKIIIIFLLFSSVLLIGQTEYKALSSFDVSSFTIIPNPYVDTTNIHFQINSNATVSLQIFDRWGSVVSTIVDNEILQLGEHNYVYVNSTLISGIYIVGLEINGEMFSENLFKTNSANSIIQVNKREEITIYPSPATNFLKVNFPNNSKREIKLISINGESVIVTESSEKNTTIDIQKIKPGLYILSIKNGLIISNEKILIE